MKFKVDESLPRTCALLLRQNGFAADTVTDEKLAGIPDFSLFERCQTEGRVLVTQDVDFADIRTFPPGSHKGIIVLRSATQDTPTLVSQLRQLFSVLAHSSPGAQLWIVEPHRIRFREE